MKDFVNVFRLLSCSFCIGGIICGFKSHYVILYIAAAISLLDCCFKLFFFRDHIIATIIGIIVSLAFKVPCLIAISFSLCFVESLFTIFQILLESDFSFFLGINAIADGFCIFALIFNTVYSNLVIISGVFFISNFILQLIDYLPNKNNMLNIILGKGQFLFSTFIFLLIYSFMGLLISFFISDSWYYCICFAIIILGSQNTILVIKKLIKGDN